MGRPPLRPEFERKFDIPPMEDEALLMLRISEALTSTGWVLEAPRRVERQYVHFDTPDLRLYRKGRTLRGLRGFPDDRIRYDYKHGPLTDRWEANYWSDVPLSPGQVVDAFGLRYDDVRVAARSVSSHVKFKAEQDGIVLRAKLDRVTVRGGGEFKEFEVEYKGDERRGRRMLSRVGDALARAGLESIGGQKYARVIEHCPRYAVR
ncbi:MAG: hypothetical protein HY369_02275 [Candidatus Aenigmarchaeota archaeon]|nr:hypothetical protein [Candidatus Aenigmarchaeota archaeon]